MTYHNYYKAPDLIGPAVAEDLGIPYVLIEATRARKRFGGPWDAYARAAEAATDAADCIFYLTQHDAEALRTYKTPAQNLVHLAPFLNRQTLPDKSPSSPHIICVGMFRAGDKMNSYTLIADTLQRLKTRDWHLSIIGDGPERAAVSDLMSPFGSRVSMLGALPPEDVLKAYQSAGILLWPGVNEAFGMIYLEAQAAGLAVVAQDRPGVRDVLAPGLPYPTEKDGPQALAERLEHLIASRTLRQNAGQTARQYVAKHHLLGNAADRLRTTLAGLTT